VIVSEYFEAGFCMVDASLTEISFEFSTPMLLETNDWFYLSGLIVFSKAPTSCVTDEDVTAVFAA